MELETKYKIARSIKDTIYGYRCQHTVDEGGGGMALLDVLTPPGEKTIKLGQQEVELLIDSICGDLFDLEELK